VLTKYSPFILAPLLLHPVAVRADAAEPGIGFGTYVQALLALALIVGLLVASAWFARKMAGGKGFGQGGLKVVGGVALGPRERIVLVETGDTWLVIGIVPGQIRTLHTLPKGTIAAVDDQTVADRPFAQWLKQISERRDDA